MTKVMRHFDLDTVCGEICVFRNVGFFEILVFFRISAYFQRNLKFIREHNERYNAGSESYYVGLNSLADLTRDEINQRLSGELDTRLF